ncbi:MAG: NAD(P)H-dependent oxidoreductase subunit E [Mariprofundus sp.]|nr:NAD(P)H-dependent oxidoreductase subunit E [Mariprofundus sp.]
MLKPNILPYQRHAIMCCGKSCGGNLPLFRYLKKRLADRGLYTDESTTVRVNKAGCLGVCCEGPIMVVYPEGVWYCQLDEVAIDRIIEEHFIGHQVVEDLCFHGLMDREV